MKKAFAIAAAIALLCLGSIAQANITIDTVAVGSAGNTGELSGAGAGGIGTDRICGSVGYNYNIGKYEVTAGQYTAFLNAVAGTDTYGLYNSLMWSYSTGCKIQQSGASGSYSYSVANDYANRPVNYVSWGDSARFANWLHNGQLTGAQGMTTTEDGAYFLNGATTHAQLLAVNREADWKWAITSEDEWYKAAYYKGGNTNAGYWLYPTSNDATPGNDMTDTSGNNANYYTGSGAYPIDSGKYTTVAGEFQNSDSPYGTFDQGGNVWEWNEAIITDWVRGLRGGTFGEYYGIGPLRASSRRSDYPDAEGSGIGFRVSAVPDGAAVPEPMSVLLAAGGLTTLLGIRRRRA